MPKILMPIGDATEALDTFYAYYRLPEEGYEVVVTGPEARLYHTVLHEIPSAWAEESWCSPPPTTSARHSAKRLGNSTK